jgi:cell division septum initiation protein DivIVA
VPKEQHAGDGGVMGDSQPAEPEAVSTQSAQSALPAPPLDIRYEDLPRKTFGYSQKATAELFDRVADAYKRVWEDRTKLERRLDKLQVELAEEREKHEDDASEAAGLTAEKLKRAEANQRELALQLKQVASALAASRAQESQLSHRVSDLETELQLAEEREQQGEASKMIALQLEQVTSALAASRAQESQLSQRVSELETELQLAGSHAQDSQLSQRVSELATKLQLAEERAVEATDGRALAEAELERFREQEHSLAEALIWARRTASESSEKAEQEAKQIVEDAERRAAELLSEGKRDVERTASEVSEKAEQEAKRIVEDAERRAAELLSEGKREVERLTSERDRLETLATEVQEDLSAFLLGALERLKERVESATEPGESVPDATGEGEGQRTGKVLQS